MRFHTYKWNEMDKEYTMLMLTESEIENESDEHAGAGYEILVLPLKYKDVHTNYLDMIRMMAVCRCGEVIYI
jgi:hypothetical protein